MPANRWLAPPRASRRRLESEATCRWLAGQELSKPASEGSVSPANQQVALFAETRAAGERKIVFRSHFCT